MNEEDRKLIERLIQAINVLSRSIDNMPRSISIYDPSYRAPGGYGSYYGGYGGSAGGR